MPLLKTTDLAHRDLVVSLSPGYRPAFALALCLWTASSLAQQSPAAPGSVHTVQPGAPGQSTKALPTGTPAQLATPSEPDIAFMRGMIMHHGQAVEMTALMAARTHNQDLLALGKRISISQTDEMGFMKRWLVDRGIPISDKPVMEHMEGMDHAAGMEHMDMDMAPMPSMPGMLTPKQMDALRKATGTEFDHLFLTGMIQHHMGALTMVKQLFDTAGAGQDPVLFDFTSDVDNTQQAEIDIMRHMLSKEKQ